MERTASPLLDQTRKPVTETGRVVQSPPCFVLLGRIGDILNALPIASYYARIYRAPIPFVVSSEFAHVVQATSYCQSIVWDGNYYETINEAVAWSKTKFNRVVCLQTGGKDFPFQRMEQHYCDEHYRLSGLQGRRGSIKLELDLRNPKREARLLERCGLGSIEKPVILYNLNGVCSPFPHVKEALALLSQFKSKATLIDTHALAAERFTDLLALYERANFMVTVDTATLHLANACSVPFAAFINDRSEWLSTTPIGNCKLAIPYSRATADLPLLEHVLRQSLPYAAEELTVSIACFNHVELTERCLSALFKHTQNFKVIVTNNASTDATAEALAKIRISSGGRLEIVSNSQNMGYQEPHNNAFAKCGTPFFCALNNDVVVGPGWWPIARRAFDADKRLAIVGNSKDVCCRLRDSFDGFPAEPETAEYVEGSLLVVRSNVIPQIGGLFSNYIKFMYGEDSDLSLRAREAGYGIKLLDLNARHLGQGTLRSLNPQGRSAVDQIRVSNHAVLKQRWNRYLRKRNFDYEILIQRLGAIGDVVDVTSILPAFKAKWPTSRISIKTNCPEVFANHPLVHESGPHVSGEFDFRYTLDLAYEVRPYKTAVESYLDVCRLTEDASKLLPQLYPSEADRHLAASLIGKRHKVVAIHAAPSWPGKTWPADKWPPLIKALIRQKFSPVFVGNVHAWALPGPGVDLRGKLSLTALCALFERCAAFIGIDSGPSHIAQAAKCPSVILFGTVMANTKLYAAAKAVGVQASVKDVPCVGQHNRMQPPVTFSTCEGECMKAISVEMVLEAFSKVA